MILNKCLSNFNNFFLFLFGNKCLVTIVFIYDIDQYYIDDFIIFHMITRIHVLSIGKYYSHEKSIIKSN